MRTFRAPGLYQEQNTSTRSISSFNTSRMTSPPSAHVPQRRTQAVVAVVALLLVAGAMTLLPGRADASPESSRKPPVATLTAQPSAAIAGEAVTLSGRVPVGARSVQLQRKSGERWVRVAVVRSDRRGLFAVRVAAVEGVTSYRAHTPRQRVKGKQRPAATSSSRVVTGSSQTLRLDIPDGASDYWQPQRATVVATPARPGREIVLYDTDGAGRVLELLDRDVQDRHGRVQFDLRNRKAGTVAYVAEAEPWRGARTIRSNVDDDTALAKDLGAGWSEVSTGSGSTCGLKTEGSAWCWGWFRMARTPTPTRLDSNSDWTDIDTSSNFGCGVRSRQLWCWGENGAGQSGVGFSSEPLMTPTRVGTDSDWVQVSIPYYYFGFKEDDRACALKSNGTVWCWGSNVHDLVPNTREVRLNSPTRVTGLPSITSIKVESGEVCAEATDGSTWCWWGEYEQEAPRKMSSAHWNDRIYAFGGFDEGTCGISLTSGWYCSPLDVTNGGLDDLYASAPDPGSRLGQDREWAELVGERCALALDSSLWCTSGVGRDSTELIGFSAPRHTGIDRFC